MRLNFNVFFLVAIYKLNWKIKIQQFKHALICVAKLFGRVNDKIINFAITNNLKYRGGSGHWFYRANEGANKAIDCRRYNHLLYELFACKTRGISIGAFAKKNKETEKLKCHLCMTVWQFVFKVFQRMPRSSVIGHCFTRATELIKCSPGHSWHATYRFNTSLEPINKKTSRKFCSSKQSYIKKKQLVILNSNSYAKINGYAKNSY